VLLLVKLESLEGCSRDFEVVKYLGLAISVNHLEELGFQTYVGSDH